MTKEPTNEPEFLNCIKAAIEDFSGNKLYKKMQSEDYDMTTYHRFLRTLFHQVRSSSSRFALAGTNTPERYWIILDYFLSHAEEEKDHWRWILDDLRNTNYRGPAIENEFPQWCTQSYIAFNYFIASRYPIARLGIAFFLESLGANLGKSSATRLCKKLQLKANQATFLFGHGDTDVGHTEDILKVLNQSLLTSDDWMWLGHSATVASKLYKQMYESVVD